MPTSNSAAAPEPARWPHIRGAPHPQLRGLPARGYAGFTEAPPRRTAGPAKTAVTLVLKLHLQRAQDAPQPAPEVTWAWRRLIATRGRLPIGRLAAEVGWSHKHLITKFKQQIGLPPKTAARLIRFDTVCRRLATHPRRPARWDQIAAEHGYADQAHLIRDFRQFTGATPTAFLAHLQR